MQRTKRENFFLILILGSLTALSPFSIDMYLPAFPDIARDFGTTVARISLSLSSYFVGLAAGQLFYGPLLDRYGRKKPLYGGLAIYILASFACLVAGGTDELIAFRFLQAIGGCAAGVATMAMVRDLFSTKESAKVFSLLVLILGVSPLLAPTVGGFVATAFGWHSVFIILALIALALLFVSALWLPESHRADPNVSLRPGPLARGYLEVLVEPQFYAHAVSGAVAFSGLFVYVAGSPVIFLETFAVSAQLYGSIFGGIAMGLIGASQLNVLLLRKMTNDQILKMGMGIQLTIAWLFFIGTYYGWFGLHGTVALLFLILSSVGLMNPNAGALSLAPFSRNAGRAAALLGFLQMSCGALASTAVGLLAMKGALPVAGILAVTSSLAVVLLAVGRSRIVKEVEVTEAQAEIALH